MRRRAISISSEDWTRTEHLQLGRLLPLVIQPTLKDLDLVEWCRTNREFIETRLLRHGGVLFRNFDVNSEHEFERFIEAISGKLMTYYDGATPRTKVGNRIYTSTDYPASQRIELHNECSYAQSWPLKIFFYCLTPALQGGATLLADSRKVYHRIEPGIREKLIERNLMYVRNFSDGLGVSWQSAFGVNEKDAAEAHCRSMGIKYEWRNHDCLRTIQIQPAVTKHPATDEAIWFNQATAFHVSTLEQSIRNRLLAEFTEEELPKNVLYGDGSPIELSVIEKLRDAYLQETVVLQWQKGDILMLDNMLTSHGREPYVGMRRVLVGMAEPISRIR